MDKKRIFLSPPHLNGKELEYVKAAFDSNYIAPLGPMVDAFEKAFCEKVGAGHAVAVSSGTAAMHLALRLLGVGPGDEVFGSTLTFIGSVTPIVFQGAVPVLIDADTATWNMDPLLLKTELACCARNGRLPKAVVPTDLYGQCADYERIYSVCRRFEVPVIVDAAEALGASYNGCGAGYGAKAAIYSFNGNKIITSSGGGMLTSDDKDFIEQARFLSQQARDPAPHYEHSAIGYNYRMSNIVAAIGLGQLETLDMRVARRREIFEYYRRHLEDLPGIEFMPEAPYGKSNRWLTIILITPEKFGADRETVRLALEEENIEARPVWKPMHLQPVFEIESKKQAALTVDRSPLTDADAVDRLRSTVDREKQLKSPPPPLSKGAGGILSTVNGQRSTAFDRMPVKARVVGGAVAEDLFDRGLCLPSGTAMTSTDLDRVIGVIKKCCKSTRH